MTRRPDANARLHRVPPPPRIIEPDRSAQLTICRRRLGGVERSRAAALVPFVGRLRRTFATQWPAPGVDHTNCRPPFPRVLAAPPKLVAECAMLERWTSTVESAVIEQTGGPDGGYDGVRGRR